MKARVCTCPRKGCEIHDAPAPEKRYPYTVARQVAEDIVAVLSPACVRIEIAGSLRRRKPDVGDIEILFVPAMGTAPSREFFSSDVAFNLADARITEMESRAMLEKRRNSKGSTMFGEKNKLMRHAASGISVDLFTATMDNWWNYLVCRTGPAELNARIAGEAKRIGWKWSPYSSGFHTLDNRQEARMESEEDVFSFIGIP